MKAKDGQMLKEEIAALEKTILMVPNTPKAQLFAARLGERLTELYASSTIKSSTDKRRRS